MRRLKWLFLLLVLALGLSCGAAAADVTAARFRDWEEISHQPEVAMLVDLGLVSGYGDGAFRPLNCVTRAEVSKIVTGLLTEARPDAAAPGRFRDTAGCWAEDYIQFCADRGVISGDAEGNFRPGDNITARELAKVLLAALGCRTDGYTGAQWSESVDADAEQLGLYKGYSKDRSLFITREDACLLINNALQCSVITGYGADGAPQYALDDMMSPKSLLEYRFQVIPATGVVEANAVADLRKAGAALEGNLIHIGGYTRDFVVSEQTAADASLLGRRVTLYARFYPTFNQVFGMPSVRAEEASLTLAGPQELQAILDYGAMTLSADVLYFEDLMPATAASLDAMVSGDTVTVVDHEGDGSVDMVFITKAPAAEAPSAEESD
ncbi:MAG: S-layer homology domain-containing protein [Oscillospiraceae bacterium]|nr:S-layer homology domain-containing protein [Oscillospiraceae bacterium]